MKYWASFVCCFRLSFGKTQLDQKGFPLHPCFVGLFSSRQLNFNSLNLVPSISAGLTEYGIFLLPLCSIGGWPLRPSIQFVVDGCSSDPGHCRQHLLRSVLRSKAFSALSALIEFVRMFILRWHYYLFDFFHRFVLLVLDVKSFDHRDGFSK